MMAYTPDFDPEIPDSPKMVTVQKINGQIMHNNQIDYLARRVYIYITPPPVFKGFPRGAGRGVRQSNDHLDPSPLLGIFTFRVGYSCNLRTVLRIVLFDILYILGFLVLHDNLLPLLLRFLLLGFVLIRIFRLEG